MPVTTIGTPQAGLGQGDPADIIIGTKTSGPRGIESVLEFNGIFLNNRAWVDTYLVTQINGIDDADVRDQREANPGRHGETPFPSYYGGRTIVLQGKIVAHTIWKLRDMEQALRKAFADLSQEYPLIFRTNDADTDMMIFCKKSSPIQMPDEQKTSTGFERPFQITLRASNPRFVSYREYFANKIWGYLEPFSVNDVVGNTNLVPNPTMETALAPWMQSVTQPVNGIRNPSVETNATDWFVYPGATGSAVATRLTTDGWQGTSCMQCALTGVTAAGSAQIGVDTTATPAGGLSVVAGDWVFLSIACKITAQAAALSNVQLIARCNNGFQTAAVGANAIINTPAVGKWYVLSGWYQVQAGVTSVAPEINFNYTTAGNYNFLGDAGMAVKVPNNSVAVPYFDGSTPGGAWSGTAHASTSSMTMLVNHVKNPSAEVDVAHWSTYQNAKTGTITRSVAQALAGAAAFALTSTQTGPGQMGMAIPTSAADAIPVTPGVKYTQTARVRAGSTARQWTVDHIYYDSNFSTIIQNTGPGYVFGNDSSAAWSTGTYTTTAPAGAAWLVVYVWVDGADNGEVHYVDCVQVTATPVAVDYFDGSYNGGSWFGTANASESVLPSLTRTQNTPPTWNGKSGTWAARMTTRSMFGNFFVSSTVPVVAGQRYQYSFNYFLSVISGVGGAPLMQLYVDWYNAASGYISTSSVVVSTTPGQGTASFFAVAPAGAVTAALRSPLFTFGGASDVVIDCYFDAELFVPTDSVTPVSYFDGSMPEDANYKYRWTGAPHASSSQRIVGDSLKQNYAFDVGLGTLDVFNGALSPADLTEKRFYRNPGETLSDRQKTIKFTPDATLLAAGAVTTIILKRLDATNYLAARLDHSVNPPTMQFGRVDNGVFTALGAATAIGAALTNGGARWLRASVVGNNLNMAVYSSDPAVAGATLVTAAPQYVLANTAAEALKFGAGITGGSGYRLVPAGIGWTYDDDRTEPLSIPAQAAITIVNNGNFESQPKIRIYGPLNAATAGGRAMTMTNDGNGQALIIKARNSDTVAIPTGNYLDIDISNQTMKEYVAATDAYVGLAFDRLDLGSDWMELIDGINNITISATSVSGTPEVQFRQRDTYM